jgi:allophanate hydrolase
MPNVPNLQLSALAKADPEQTLRAVYARIAEVGAGPTFIELVPLEKNLERLAQLAARRSQLPLFGVPFAVKDNFDVEGLPTTAACPAFAYTAGESAVVVQRLLDAGAILIGKTNMDQFATGLVGTRSPYGVCSSVFDPRYISGGSSSGSALAVALGFVSFALGTDTAGSGRVPAAFNNIVGLKPTRGLVSTRGLLPACRSLDCASVFAGSVADAARVLDAIGGFDAKDMFSREACPAAALGSSFRFGVPRALEFFGNAAYEALFAQTVKRLQALGGTAVELDVEPFVETGKLLYGGPWVAERYAAVGEFVETHAEATHPVVRDIVLGGKAPAAYELFSASYRLAELRRATEPTWQRVDVLLLPTAGTHYRIDEVLADPFTLNANLGRYTNFVNLLDLAGLALPAGFSAEGLPFGVTLLGPAFSEARLCAIGGLLEGSLGLSLGATGHAVTPSTPRAVTASSVLLAVAGAHLSGMPLNHELTSRGATLVRTCRTSPEYALYALQGTVPAKPGVVRRPGLTPGGIEVEIWALDAAAFGSFVANVPAPMVIGTVTLEDGALVKGFLCEPYALEGSREITSFGGWRAFTRSV